MKTIKLEEAEYTKIAVLIDKYREIEHSLTGVQNQLESLDQEKNQLMSNLDTLRDEEVSFFQKIEEKYGKGKFDLLTMEYITN